MKPLILSICVFALALQTFAQTGPILIAKTSEGGNSDDAAGTIIQYIGGDTLISNTDILTSGNPSNCNFANGPDGKLYGVLDDGASGTDALIAYDYASNTYTTVATFNSATGSYPQGSLLLVGNTFYGLAYTGGANNGGTLYSYTIGADSVTKLVDLPADAYPSGGLTLATDGYLYGVTYQDGVHKSGTLFRYNIDSASYTSLVDLPSYAHPYSTLVQVGDSLFGMNTNDSLHSTGDIFSYNIVSGNYAVQYYFPGTHTFSLGSLIMASDGFLYGTTTDGGTYGTNTATGGTLFRYKPGTGEVDTLHNFGNGQDGGYLYGSVMQASDGNLYGMTNEGGTANGGTIYQYNIGTNTYALKVNLSGITGYYPGFGSLVEYTPVTAHPLLYTLPDSATVCSGAQVTFTVADSVAHTGAQWQVSTDSGKTFANILQATDSSYTFVAYTSQNGYQYRAIITGSNAPDTSLPATLTVDSSCGAGITGLQDSHFNLYPNPTSNSFTIEHNYTGNLTVNIINLLGEKLRVFNMTTREARFDISDLAAGIYQVQIIDGEQILRVMKVVKE